MIGLGTGTIAAYGRLGDYSATTRSIPLVLRTGHDSSFTSWTIASARLDVAMGDARLSLERTEGAAGEFRCAGGGRFLERLDSGAPA